MSRGAPSSGISLAVQTTGAVEPAVIGPWAGLGVLAVWAGTALAFGGGAVRPRRRSVMRPTALGWLWCAGANSPTIPLGNPGEETMVRALFSFPNPVNEISARLVAAGVVLMSVTTIVFDLRWMVAVIAYGFVARVLTGPTLSPLGQLVTRVITPALRRPAKPVPGPPKRFAQGIGAVLSVTAAVLVFGFGQVGAGYIVLGLIVVAATLESVFGFCLGCQIFRGLMRLGVIPEPICVECADIWARGRQNLQVGA